MQWRSLLVYGELGWVIERESYADEFLERLDKLIADCDANALANPSWLTERNPEVLRLVPDRIEDSQTASAAICRVPNRSVARDTLEAPGSPISNRGTLWLRQDLK